MSPTVLPPTVSDGAVNVSTPFKTPEALLPASDAFLPSSWGLT